jgi:putative transposase
MNSLRLGLDDGPQRPKPSSNPGIWIRNNKPDHGKSANLPALTSFPWCYGPEFTSRRMLGWAEERKINLIHIQPGRPMQNGHVESFHGRLRDECLNASWFRTLNDVRRTLHNWRQEYNCERPHSSLAYRTPAEFSRTLGYGDVESKQRFPHPHSPDYDGGEIYSPTNLNRETPAING